MLLILLLGVATGLPLSRSNHDSMSNDVLLSRVLAHKDNPKLLASLFADADPAAIQEVIVLVDALLATSQGELANLTNASSEANATYDGAVTAHNAAIVAQQTGNQTLDNNYATAVLALQVTRDDGKAAYQTALDSALTTKDGAEQAKTLANELLAQGSVRLNGEIVSITEIRRILLTLLPPPTSAPTTSAPTNPPTASTPVFFSPISATFYIDGSLSTTYRTGRPTSLIDGSGLHPNNLQGVHYGLEAYQFGWQRQGSHDEYPRKYSLVFTFDRTYNVDHGYLWNWADGCCRYTGVTRAEFYTSTDGGSTWDSNPVESTFGQGPRTAQEFPMNRNANAVKMVFLEVGDRNDAAGLSEIKFTGQPI